MIKVIIFDWHGVLDKIKFEGLATKLAKMSGNTVDEIKNKIHTTERQYAAGNIVPAEFWHKTRQILNLDEKQIDDARKYITSFYPNDALWKELPKLKNKYRLTILSDCPLDKLEEIRKKSDLNQFEITDFSAEAHLLKDKDNFFTNHIAKLKLKPSECLYIDDQQKHVDSAKRIGMSGLKYEPGVNILKKLNSL